MRQRSFLVRNDRRREHGSTCVLALVLLAAAGAPAGVAIPYRVSDVLEGNTMSSALGAAVTMSTGDMVLATTRSRLFVTDGTAGGTRELDIGTYLHPWTAVAFGDRTAVVNGYGNLYLTDWTEGGTVALKEGVCASPLFVALGRLFFFSWDALGIPELWASDGSPAGTTLLAKVGAPIGPVFDLGDRVVLVAGGLWATDGTPEGTSRLRDDITAIDEERAAIAAPGRLLFVPGGVTTFCAGVGLWVTDGTADGTRLVREFLSTQSDFSACTAVLREHAAVGNRLVFNGWDATHGVEPWVSDGTPEGTVMLADVRPGTCGSMPADFAAVGASAVFFADDGVSGREPWTTDGTAEQTVLLCDACAGPAGSSPFVLGMLRDELVLAVRSVPDRMELLATDGTPAGLRTIADLPLISARAGTTRAVLGTHGSLVFVAEDVLHGSEPWVTDGTAAGTRLVRDICPGSRGSSAQEIREGRNGVVMWADDGVHGSEPWLSDLSAEGTAMLADIDMTPAASPTWCVAADGRLFFRAYTEETGSEPYVTDGTASGTRLVRDIRPGAEGSGPTALRPCGTRVLFSADDGEHGEELWASDGMDGDAALLADRPPAPGSTAITCLGTLGSLELFAPFVARARNDLWVTDGTAAGTRLLQTFTLSPPGYLWRGVELNGRFYFSGYDGVHGMELWVTDGTVEGTRLFLDLAEGADSSWPNVPVRLGDLLFFGANAGDAFPSGCLWQTDGTIEGTRRVCSDGLEELASCPKPFVVLNDRLLCIGERAGIDGDALWSLDGTCGGARFVRDLGASWPGPRLYGAAEGRCFFEVGGCPWVTDGTAEGTMRASAKSVMRGVLGGGRLYFVSTDGASGIQGGDVWMADGAAEDTESLVYTPLTGSPEAPDLFGAEGRAFLTKPVGLFQSSRTRGGMYIAHDADIAVTSSFCVFMNKPRSEPIKVGDLLYYWVSEGAGEPPRLWAVPVPDGESVFVRGDANEDGVTDIADPISILDHLFAGRPMAAACADALDANDDGAADIADPIWLLTYLFAEGPPPRPPSSGAGFDLTKDALPGC